MNTVLYGFNLPVERRGTMSIEYDSALKNGMPEDILPLWIADMGFRVPPCVTDALQERL